MTIKQLTEMERRNTDPDASPATVGWVVFGGTAVLLGFAFIPTLTALILIYFIPWLVAMLRHHRRLPIFLLNLFLGWTLVGWVAALVWAVMPKDAR